MALDKDVVQFIKDIAPLGPWCAALGTLSAVVTSLYLANRGERFKMKASFRTVFEEETGKVWNKKAIHVEVTNVGIREGIISAVFMKSLKYRLSLHDPDLSRERMLREIRALGYGDKRELNFPLTQFVPGSPGLLFSRPEAFYMFGVPWQKLSKAMLSQLARLIVRVRVLLMNIAVVSATGKEFTCWLDKHSRAELCEQLLDKLKELEQKEAERK